jgi:hypothetical protein
LSEARRNLKDPAQVGRLDALSAEVEVVNEAPPDAVLPGGVSLPDKDAPILLAAINAQATHLLTGDKRHFGPYFGLTVAGVRIEVPASYLAGKLTE